LASADDSLKEDGMIPRPAQYLLRFDDLCPTVEQHRWQGLRDLVLEFGIRPILAVIPDNQDPAMECSPADPGFWAQMREMEAAGATIAAHGFQHLCEKHSKNLIGLHQKTEFAGLGLEVQRQRVQAGLRTLREHGLNPRLWVAPRHTFDMTTLRAIRQEGIDYISDGLARIPFTRGGVTWIPQQLWSPVEKSKGLWTICVHSNSTMKPQFLKLQSFLRKCAEQFTSFDRVVAEFNPGELGFTERMYERYATWRLQLHRKRTRHRRKRKT
jgi:hypothetical protein